MWDDPEYPAEFKYHGCRYLMYCHGAHNTFLSRHVSVKGGYVDKSNHLPHLRDIDTTKLRGTILDGEIILKLFGTVRDVTSILGSSVDLAIEKQEQRGYLSYMVFDLPYYRGDDIRHLPLLKRKKLLEKVVTQLNVLSIHTTDLHFHDKENFYQEIVKRGGEGVILKYIYSKYGERKHWIKVKKNKTLDVVIIGYKAPSDFSIKKGSDRETVTRYAMKGWVGSIAVGMWTEDHVELIDCGFVSGMDEETRAMISKNPKKYIGKVIEVKAQSQLESGKFEHGRFIRWREDKASEDCVYDEQG
jgi:ATP-dependent DNA ligase